MSMILVRIFIEFPYIDLNLIYFIILEYRVIWMFWQNYLRIIIFDKFN
ncbi:hypothetical protein ES705_16535 [subsurface metagenome]